ncbi:Protein of unknown function [Lishizhenia tianjinensis]|uniref:DUF3124 domain-containing protein n=1 Tax=Lishizhenia tianjinensis TaxID=477690 RepID=A0A1I6YDD3_9FLAO|nr:DUF3124 domain-containing protein [Lishizhenia tianjinensis]SFT48546.1 Protein of unknown function [Lishizhenia tianjinensis]
MQTKLFYLLLLPCISLLGCSSQTNIKEPKNIQFEQKKVDLILNDSLLLKGSTHLSVYSSIYSQTEHRTHNLTATVSMRNVNLEDSLYITKAIYHDTKGNPVRTYFNYPVGMGPLETLEIIINEADQEGGTGGNFIFEWYTPANKPHFEAVMISTSGQQGISFRTEGINLK